MYIIFQDEHIWITRKRTLLNFLLHQFPKKNISKFTKISIYHLVLMLSTCKETGCTYLPTKCSISTLSQLKYGSTNSVHMSTLTKLKHSLKLHRHLTNILLGSGSRIKTGSECQADSRDTENTRAWRRSRSSLKFFKAILL